jgi:hypothetical protein
LAGIAFCLKHGKLGDIRRAVLESIDEATSRLTRPASRAGAPRNLSETIIQLQQTVLGLADDRDSQAKAWTAYQQKISDELVRPLTSQAAASQEPTERALLMALAGISQLAHPQAMAIAVKVARSVREWGVGQTGPLPEKELQQLLGLSDRMVALVKQREQIEGSRTRW